jgi:subtilisin family serine protease
MRLAVLALAAVASAAPILRNLDSELVEGSWIVVLHGNTTDENHKAHLLGLEKFGVDLDKHIPLQYNNMAPWFRGYQLLATDEQVAQISEMNDIKYIEQDGIARAIDAPEVPEEDAACVESSTTLWGLARVSAAAPSTGTFRGDNRADPSVLIAIMDTGLRYTHQQFGGRARFERDFTGQGPSDGHGHGTHCGGTAGGSSFGVARSTTLIDIKVLNSQGSGQWAWIVGGLDHSAGLSRAGNRIIGSMSLGGGRNQAANDAVDAAFRAGGVMVVASGNSNANACNFSPASAPEAITVNSMQNGDSRSSFSNFGTCTQIFAPGTSIQSAWHTSDTATNTISGTSMACPHVAGIAAEIWNTEPSMDNNAVRARVSSIGATNRITNPGTGSPNVLAQTTCAQ